MSSEFEVIQNLLQHHLESFEDEYWQRRDKIQREKIGQSTEHGLIVRAGFAAGWFGDEHKTDIEPDKRVENMSGAEVAYLAIALDESKRACVSINPKARYKLAVVSLMGKEHLETLQKLGDINPGEILRVKGGDNGLLEVLAE